ncbi:hypothetical protein EDD11_007824 [Mortierella claussenii]|nr:hypothetical protein EDD11_007824 [Mortierella claussenii]
MPGDVAELFGVESLQDRNVLPGDFVEVRRGGKAMYGVFLQSFNQSEGRLQSTTVIQGDGILAHRTADVTFRIPGFAFMDRVQSKIGNWDVETNLTSPPAGIGKAASLFAEEARVVMGTFYTRFEGVYDTFWHKRGQRWLSTPQAAKFVFDKEGQDATPLTLQELYATHLYLTQDVNLTKFTPSIAVRWTGEFAMRPPHEVLLTETVIKWMHQDDPRFLQFQEKAKSLITSYRAGSKSAWKGVQFSDSDRTLIEFVRQTAFHGYSDVFLSPNLAYLPRLLRPLGLYEDIDPSTAFHFLNEIGIWPSWYNMEINRSAVELADSLEEDRAIMDRIDLLNPETSQRIFEKEIERIKEEAAVVKAQERDGQLSGQQRRMNPILLQDPKELYKRDPCDAIRHDFGFQPVYAIDDPSASELDDGFSIEPVPVTSLTPTPSIWVHVHVADPTSILPPLHEISRLAASRIQTAYLPEGTWPMLPRALTEGTLSLQNDGTPKKVMTFSARLSDDNGELLEYKVRPGIVRNVVTLNYDEVDEVLSWDCVYGGKAEGDRVRAAILRTPETLLLDRQYYRATKGTLDKEDKELVNKLLNVQKVAGRHYASRLQNGAFNFQLGRPSIELAPYPLRPVLEGGWEAPVDYSEWQQPQITCRLDPSYASPSRIMVAEYMVLAGRVAALFSQEHGLPTLFRNQREPEQKYLEMLNSIIQNGADVKTGMLGLVDMLPVRPHIPGAEISTTSLGHWSLGLKSGYSKVTSPLRRYTDMVSHWQMKGALLSEHDSSTVVAAPPPVFSLEVLMPLSNFIRDRERMLGMLEARSVKFWLYEMLRRRMEAGLPQVFEGVFMNPTSDGYNVLSTLLGFSLVVKAEPADMAALSIGSKVSFEVNNANPQRPYLGGRHLCAL